MGGFILENQDVKFNLEEVETKYMKDRFDSGNFIPLQTELILRLKSDSSLLLRGLLADFSENLAKDRLTDKLTNLTVYSASIAAKTS